MTWSQHDSQCPHREVASWGKEERLELGSSGFRPSMSVTHLRVIHTSRIPVWLSYRSATGGLFLEPMDIPTGDSVPHRIIF